MSTRFFTPVTICRQSPFVASGGAQHSKVPSRRSRETAFELTLATCGYSSKALRSAILTSKVPGFCKFMASAVKLTPPFSLGFSDRSPLELMDELSTESHHFSRLLRLYTKTHYRDAEPKRNARSRRPVPPLFVFMFAFVVHARGGQFAAYPALFGFLKIVRARSINIDDGVKLNSLGYLIWNLPQVCLIRLLTLYTFPSQQLY